MNSNKLVMINVAFTRNWYRLSSITNLMHISFILYIYIYIYIYICMYTYIYYIIVLDMFRAILCSSSGGQIVLLQNLVSSLSVSSRTVHRLRADCSTHSTGALYRVTIPDAVTIQLDLLRMSIVLLEICLGL
jgi:hypothetical protein